MSSPEKQPTPAAANTPAEAPADTTLSARRLLVWVLAFVIGGVVSALVMVGTRIPLDATLLLSFINIPFLPLVAIPAGFFFVIWIDYFMGTKIVPD